MKQNVSKYKAISSNFVLCFIAIFFYGLMEWLFLFTKPSYLSGFGFTNYLSILLFIATLAFWISVFWIIPISIVSTFFTSPIILHWTNIVARLLPAITISSLCIILFDNFTYTIFSTGIFSLKGLARGIYGILYLLLIIYWQIYFYKKTATFDRLSKKAWNSKVYRLVTVIIFSVLFLLPISKILIIKEPTPFFINQYTKESPNLPNIVLITGDGVNADHLSVYGYERNTSPRLLELSEYSLIAENAFSNSGNTAGSITSMLTSKYTTQTRMVFPPNILRDNDSFEHLPGILKALGYKTIQIGFPYYVDADVINFLDGFDIVNGRGSAKSTILPWLVRYDNSDDEYFIRTVIDRIISRVRYFFFLDESVIPFELIHKPVDPNWDSHQISELLSYIDRYQPKQPLFVHVHLLGTHGPRFNNKIRVFSDESSASKNWDTDEYDDAIYNFDFQIGRIIDFLTQNGLSDNTIIIIGSDHGQQWEPREKIPLLIHFPFGSFSGRIYQNVQNLDIAPTILDYLQVQIPEWMQGESLLKPIQPDRPVLSAGLATLEVLPDGSITPPEMELTPPFYQFGIMTVVYCDKWYQLDLKSSIMLSGNIKNSTLACPDIKKAELSVDEVYSLMIENLQKNGFDTSSIKE